MKIIIDADACPVTKIVEDIAKERQIEVVIFCDNNHYINSSYSEVKVVESGADAADYAIFYSGKKDDIIVTQDYGLASMVLGKGCYAIHQSGRWYTNDNIDRLLLERHQAKKERSSKKKTHMKGPKKRTKEDDMNFTQSLIKLIERVELNNE